MELKKAFVAYPGYPPEISSYIQESVRKINSDKSLDINFHTWEHNDIAGRPIILPILSGIEDASLLVADITRLNFNVSYEIGYAIGFKKRVLLIRNSSLKSDEKAVIKTGIFDTLGYQPYKDSIELADILKKTLELSPINISSDVDTKAPLYLLETPVRTLEMTRIVARVKRARLFYRSFTPSEDARLAAIDAIRHVSKSIGVLVPLLSPDFTDAQVHNIRAAFVAGLSHGMGKETLVLQDGRHSIPLDLRDSAETYFDLEDINSKIEQFAGNIYEKLQKREDFIIEKGSLLQNVSLGDPMAENEFQNLTSYYVQTDEFNRALRGEVNMVVGRKGTGKTALFFQVRDRVRKDKRNIVIDLKPEGYQLIKLKENVLDLLSEGAKGHLITAFWEYLLLMEICRKVLEKDKNRPWFDDEMNADYSKLDRIYKQTPVALEGDFSERLLMLSQRIIDEYAEKYGKEKNVRITADEITNLLHATSIADLRMAVSIYLEYKEQVLVLFDNLDKGWSYKGIGTGDILILRCLIDASRKVQKDMRRNGIKFSSIVFVRNDIYQLLMDSSPDFGKETRASLDWSDSDLLREVLRRRLAQSFDKDISFQQVWGLICASHYNGEETSQYLIDRSLMRPRNLLKLVSYCKGFAVNLDHERIEQEDITKGLRSYSNDLVLEADRELTDVEPLAEGLLYEFVEEPSEMEEHEVHAILKLHGITEEKIQYLTDHLLYLGFLGIKIREDDAKYIYDYGYDLKILNAVRRKNKENSIFVFNPSFWPALEIASSQ